MPCPEPFELLAVFLGEPLPGVEVVEHCAEMTDAPIH